jgi:hypothetical protein
MSAEIHDGLMESLNPRMFDPGESAHVLSLSERFVLPPFSQLDARSGAWQERKRRWLDLGIRSGEGRTARTFADNAGTDEVSQKILALTGGQSIFDPVLCEMAYRWFCPPGGYILDPFAGGSVRGIVAAVTGRHYVGVDLSADQCTANRAQDADFVGRGIYPDDMSPEWLDGDSADITELLTDTGYGDPFDFVWSCPPYHDLEKYSDDPRDLSNMPWEAFLEVYGAIIGEAIDHLADDRFCGFVVGEIRGKDGFYRHFVNHTVDAFERAGASYYNEALLVSPAGTLPLRSAAQFVATRKLGRTHQTVLLFVKGDPKAATAMCADADAEAAALRAAGRDPDQVYTDDEDYSGMAHG